MMIQTPFWSLVSFVTILWELFWDSIKCFAFDLGFFYVHIKLWWWLRIHFAHFQWGIPVLNPPPTVCKILANDFYTLRRKDHLCLTANCNGYKQEQGRKRPAPHPVWRYCLKSQSQSQLYYFLRSADVLSGRRFVRTVLLVVTGGYEWLWDGNDWIWVVTSAGTRQLDNRRLIEW